MSASQLSPATMAPLSNPSLVRGQILAMGACYALGTFNDNFFKQAALLLAVKAGMHAFQGQATFLFALPFMLLCWLADRFSKKTIIVCAKLLEVAAMLAGAYGMVTLHWGWLGMVFCMGLNSTLFSPALNGAIPELFPVERIPGINALFKLPPPAPSCWASRWQAWPWIRTGSPQFIRSAVGS